MSEESLAKDRQSARQGRANAKGKFTKIMRRMDDCYLTVELEMIQDLMNELSDAHTALELKHDDYISLFDADDDKEKIAELVIDMDKVYKQFCDMKAMVLRRKRTETGDVKMKSVCANSNVKVKKLDAPMFSGNVRAFPSFLRDFERHMIPHYGKDPYALKSCLTEDALATVMGVDDDYDSMLGRLKIRYGRREKLTDFIIQDIRNLQRLSDGKDSKFVEMVSVIERCWLDLKQSGLEGELNNATVMNQIEWLLPSIHVQQREWTLRKQRLESDKYDFQIFLDEEIRAMEYMHSNVRNIQSKRRINTTVGESHSNGRDDQSPAGAMQAHMRIEDTLNKVVDGLAQVAQLVSTNIAGTYSQAGAQRNFRCWFHETDSHDISSCSAFGKMDVKSRVDLLNKHGGCFSCLKLNHRSNKCLERRACAIINTQNQRCGRMHHPSLHSDDNNIFASQHTIREINNNKTSRNVVLMISTVKCRGRLLATLYDPGADISLITHRMANELGLKGIDVTLSITKVGNSFESVSSKRYIVPLTDESGDVWRVHAYGIDEVTADIGHVDVRRVVSLFDGITEDNIKRPSGKVDLLIGTDCFQLMPIVVKQSGSLQLLRNTFGYCVRGSHDLLVFSGLPTVNNVRIHVATIVRGDLNGTIVSKTISLKDSLDKFFDIDALGTHCVPKCGSCKCGKCPDENKDFTIKEEHELALIENGLHFDSKKGQWTADYPWIKDPTKLPNNYTGVLARLKSTERRLQKAGTEYTMLYCAQINDMISRNVACKLTAFEMNQYKGPVHYLPHHEIMKPESASTPMRIVFNSSASYMGHVLNDYWAKGPNVINDMVAVLMRFREGRFAIVGDVSKIYNSVAISQMDQHTHRFLWRNMQFDRVPEHYVLQAVTFGDRPSGTIAMAAMRKSVDMANDVSQAVKDMVYKNSYVDDILQSVDTIDDARQLACEVGDVLAHGGFFVKHWVGSWETSSDNSEQLTVICKEEEKVLGMRWQPGLDYFRFNVTVNLSKKSRCVVPYHMERDILMGNVPHQLTRCMVLSQMASIFDPLGFIMPFVLKAKLLLRKLCVDHLEEKKPYDWDMAIPEEDRRNWIAFFRKLFDVEELRFPRSVKPSNTIGNPILILFSDGSNVAYGTCAYVRWELENGQFESRLILAKGRIAQ